MKKINILFMLTLIIIVVSVSIGYAEKKPLKSSKSTIYEGQTMTVTFKPSKMDKTKMKKAKWSVKGETGVIKITTKNSKGKNKISVKGKGAGTAYVCLKYGKKTYRLKVTVKEPAKAADNRTTEKDKEPTDNNQPPVQPGTTETTDKVLTDDDYVDPASLIGNLVVTSSWYFDPEGKEKVTEDLVLGYETPCITMYNIVTYTMNGEPVPLDKLKAAQIGGYTTLRNLGLNILYAGNCDGTESDTMESYVKSLAHRLEYSYELTEYSTDGKIVLMYSTWNDFYLSKWRNMSVTDFTKGKVSSKSGVIGVENDISSFSYLPEFMTTDVVGEWKFETYGPSYQALSDQYSFKKVNTMVTDDGVKITQHLYQLCKNASESISYARRADFIYKDDLTKYNVGYYYRFNDLCDECKPKQAASDELVTAIRELKSRALEEYFIPLAYNGSEPYAAPYQGWANTIYGKGRTPGTSTGFTAINLTGTNDEQGRMVYQYPYGANPPVYPDGAHLTLQFVGGLTP